MGTKIYVAPPEATEWRIPPKQFAAYLRKRWRPVIAWLRGPDDPNAIWFKVRTRRGMAYGHFTKDGTMLVLERCSSWVVGEIAVWFRSLVPPEQSLLIFSGGGEGYSELKPTDTAEEVARRFQ